MNPRGRQDQLLVEELPGELLVYDLIRNQAHCLNQAAAFIWQQCDGRTTVREIAARLPGALGLPDDEALVWLALDRLGRAGLLRDQPPPPAAARQLGRRDLIRKLGLTGSVAVLLPLISTAEIPAAAEAASRPCTPPDCDCASTAGTQGCCQKQKKPECETCCNNNFGNGSKAHDECILGCT